MQKAAKEKVLKLIFAIASVLFLCAPSTASSTPTPGLENRVELFLLGAENRTKPPAFDTANRVENYDSRWGTALESSVAPRSAVTGMDNRAYSSLAEQQQFPANVRSTCFAGSVFASVSRRCVVMHDL